MWTSITNKIWNFIFHSCLSDNFNLVNLIWTLTQHSSHTISNFTNSLLQNIPWAVFGYSLTAELSVMTPKSSLLSSKMPTTKLYPELVQSFHFTSPKLTSQRSLYNVSQLKLTDFLVSSVTTTTTTTIIQLSWSWATCWPISAPIIQKSF